MDVSSDAHCIKGTFGNSKQFLFIHAPVLVNVAYTYIAGFEFYILVIILKTVAFSNKSNFAKATLKDQSGKT